MATMTAPDTTSGAHYGADYNNFVSEWDGAITDITFGIREGYLDKHMGELVKAIVKRRQHLAEHNLVPDLPVDPSRGQAESTSSKPMAGTAEAQAAADVASVQSTMSTTEPFVTVAGKRFPKAEIVGKHVALRDFRNMTGAIVQITGMGKTRPEFKLAADFGGEQAGLTGTANLEQIGALFNLSS